MSEGNIQRVFLACGSALLLIFSFATAVAIGTFGSGVQFETIAAIALAVTMAILLLNETLLCATNGGQKVLATAKTLLWLSFLLMAVAIGLCIVSMSGSL